MHLSAHGTSHQGYERSENEDAFACDVAGRFFAVADGLGGLPDGALASGIAIEIVEQAFKRENPPTDYRALERLMRTAHAHVLAEGRRQHPESGIGTTLTVGFIQGDNLVLGHVGDSAIYRWRPGGSLETLTREHTLATLYRSRLPPGEELPAYFEHTLTQCIGMSETFEPDLSVQEIGPTDRLLFCTDGITKVLKPRKIQSILSRARSPEVATAHLEKAVLAAGAPDNLTAVVVFIE